MYDLDSCEKLWEEAGRHGTEEERIARTARWLPWYAYLAGKASLETGPDEAACRFSGWLQQQGYLRPWDRVLDIGAGMGNYTLALANSGASVLAVDPSAACLDLLRKRADAASVCVDTKVDYWERFQPEETFDLVFSAMCPAICSVSELQKMESFSRRSCCIVTVARGSYDKHRRAMMAGLGVKPEGGMVTEALHYYNALYLMGRQPEVICHRVKSRMRLSAEAGLERYSLYFEIFGVPKDRSRAFLTKYLEKNAVDGVLEEESQHNFAMLCWSAGGDL